MYIKSFSGVKRNCVNFERIVGHSKKQYQLIGVCLEGLRKTTGSPSRGSIRRDST